MDDNRRERLERDVRALCDARDYAAAATMAIRGYGPEILGFLHAVHPSETDATDAFAELSEILWRKLPDFNWESTLRTWAYGIARNVSRVLRRNAGRRRRREAAVGESALEDVAQAVRTETLAHLRTQTKTRLQALRDTLPEEDRMLLVLRVDRKLEWNELARVLAEAAEGDEAAAQLADADVTREAARLRKRFQLLKDRLREMAKREGLIG
ncbi:MAG: RNA polymerase sigma factor [Polyangiaceae bacterium]